MSQRTVRRARTRRWFYRAILLGAGAAPPWPVVLGWEMALLGPVAVLVEVLLAPQAIMPATGQVELGSGAAIETAGGVKGS